jgi:hypothetical protein
MKRIIVLGCFGLFVAGAALAAEGSLRELPAERFAAAGLHKLTAEELAQLEAVIAERVAAQAKAAPAETRSAPATAPSSGPGWLRALLTLQETSEKPDGAEAIESRLVGDYDGWTGRTNFKLENGQIWQQAGSAQRVDNRRAAPKVKVYPGMMGAYWLEVEGVRERVKVKPVKLK